MRYVLEAHAGESTHEEPCDASGCCELCLKPITRVATRSWHMYLDCLHAVVPCKPSPKQG